MLMGSFCRSLRKTCMLLEAFRRLDTAYKWHDQNRGTCRMCRCCFPRSYRLPQPWFMSSLRILAENLTVSLLLAPVLPGTMSTDEKTNRASVSDKYFGESNSRI